MDSEAHILPVVQPRQVEAEEERELPLEAAEPGQEEGEEEDGERPPAASEDYTGQSGPGQSEEGQSLPQGRDQTHPPAAGQPEDQREVHGRRHQRGQDSAPEGDGLGGRLCSLGLRQGEEDFPGERSPGGSGGGIVHNHVVINRYITVIDTKNIYR